MSLILCRQEEVRHPFYVEALGVHIWSSQELCYVIYNYPLLVMDHFLDERLTEFIEKELRMTVLAAKLENGLRAGADEDELIFMFLEECHFYSPKEITAFRQKISSYRNMGSMEFAKATADYYYTLRQYGTALRGYEKLLDSQRNKAADDEFLGKIWNNMGACYAGLFWFDKAMQAYEMSWSYRKDPDTVKRMYHLTLLDPKLSVRARFGAGILEDRKEQWKEEFDETVSRARQSESVRQAEELFNQEKAARRQAEGELLSKWKAGYRAMI